MSKKLKVPARKEEGDIVIKNEVFVSSHLKEIKSLKSQLNGLEEVLKLNSLLEVENKRLNSELEASCGSVIKRGYLYKLRDREISFANRWGLRYFVLQGSTISYFGDVQDQRPRRTFDLSNCIVRAEGIKKGGAFYVFSIYLISSTSGAGSSTASSASLLLKLSTESEADRSQWIEMLEQACAFKESSNSESAPSSPDAKSKAKGDFSFDSIDSKRGFENELRTTTSYSASNQHFNQDNVITVGEGELIEDWSSSPAIETELPVTDSGGDLSPALLKRVRSSNAMLKKSQSRQTLARKILLARTPIDFQISVDSGRGGGGSRTEGLAKDSKVITVKSFKPFPGSKPMHIRSNVSPLSSESRPSEQNYRGFFNLGVIILVLSHARLIMDSHVKHGFVPAWRGLAASTRSPIKEIALSRPLLSIFSWLFSILISYSLEHFSSKNLVSEKVLLVVSFIIGTLNIVLPCLWVWNSKPNAGASMIYLFQSIIIWMKLISYAHANRDLRIKWQEEKAAKKNKEKNEVLDENAKPHDFELAEVKDLRPPFLHYPRNLTIVNLLYFCIVPTLCYQLNFPRLPKIRWQNAFWILVRIFLVSGLILFSVEQYIKPTLANSIVPLDEMDILEIVERVLKLSIPNTWVWLLIFYSFFHLWLNLLAELTGFADRSFYRDWWNARTIDVYWRNWNLPVHNWMVRHVFHPLLRAGMPKVAVMAIVFLLSAVLHEVIISVSFRHVSFHAFFGMVLQFPLIEITKFFDKRFDNAFVGNAIFWLMFCVVGQPLGVLMYYYEATKRG